MRVVLDTNVLVSGIFWTGPPHRLLQLIVQGQARLLVSPGLLRELGRTLGHRKLSHVLARTGRTIPQILDDVRRASELVEAISASPGVSRDPDDDAVLALAVAGSADLIVSGDRDLLVLQVYGQIPIRTPAEAMEIMAP